MQYINGVFGSRANLRAAVKVGAGRLALAGALVGMIGCDGGGGGGGIIPQLDPPPPGVISIGFDSSQASGGSTVLVLAAGVLDPGIGEPLGSVDFVAITDGGTPVLPQLFDDTAPGGTFPFMLPLAPGGPYASGLTAPGTVANKAPGAHRPGGAILADMDGDGRNDLVVGDGTTGMGPDLEVALNDANMTGNEGELASTGLTVSYGPPGGQPRRIAMADFDGDFDVDVVTANEKNDSFTILLNTPPPANILVDTPHLVAPGAAIDVAVGRFDDDAAADIIGLVGTGTNVRVVVWLDEGLPFPPPPQNPDLTFPMGGPAVGFAVANFDNDPARLADVIVLRTDGTLEIAINDPANPGTLLPAISVATGFGPGEAHDLVAASFSDLGPAGVDLVVIGDAADDGFDIRFFANNGVGMLFGSAKFSTSTGAAPTAVIAGDFDGDGDNDVVVGLEDGTLELYGNLLVVP